MLRDLGSVVFDQLWQPVDVVDDDSAFPGEVVETDVVKGDRLGPHAEQSGEESFEADGDVAQPDGAVLRLQQRAGEDADRVGEVDDPRAGCGAPTYLLGDLEYDGDR